MLLSSLVSTRKRMSGFSCSIVAWSWAVLAGLLTLLVFINRAFIFRGFVFFDLIGVEVLAGFGPKAGLFPEKRVDSSVWDGTSVVVSVVYLLSVSMLGLSRLGE